MVYVGNISLYTEEQAYELFSCVGGMKKITKPQQ
jgi:hypothetical protein